VSVDENARSQTVAVSASFACEAQKSVSRRPERENGRQRRTSVVHSIADSANLTQSSSTPLIAERNGPSAAASNTFDESLRTRSTLRATTVRSTVDEELVREERMDRI
jgi:hypothetical protein